MKLLECQISTTEGRMSMLGIRKIMTGILAMSLLASFAYTAQGIAAPGKGNGKGAAQGEVKNEKRIESKGKKDKETVTDSVYSDRVDGGKGPNGSKGLKNAYQHVHNTPAGSRIAELLKSKYKIDVTKDTDLTKLVTELESSGDLEAAAQTQSEVILADIRNLDGYKLLGKLKIKLGDRSVKTYVNGVAQSFDVPAIVENGRTLVPFRGIAEALNAGVKYDPATKTVTIVRGEITVELVVGSKTAYINEKPVALDVPGKMKNNRVLVPLKFLSEALNADVMWDAETGSAIVVDKAAPGDTETQETAQE
jgi:hypothetical protein